jgi:hypothetical protein
MTDHKEKADELDLLWRAGLRHACSRAPRAAKIWAALRARIDASSATPTEAASDAALPPVCEGR